MLRDLERLSDAEKLYRGVLAHLEATLMRPFYGEETYARLVAVKDRWDPHNLFCHNQNIRPSA